MIRTKFAYLLVPVLAVLGCHALMTGSPIPLWHFEKLNNPIAVESITDAHILTADGREISLPYIIALPNDDPLFQEAISDGIEINDDGTVFGLMWLDRNCGNDPVLWRHVRVNLSELAGAINPKGIDSLIVHPDAIDHLQEDKHIDSSDQTRSHQNHHLQLWDMIKMRAVREQFSFSAQQSAA